MACMVFEKLIRYIGLAVGLKPSATGCEARLRGLERIIYSKTISVLSQNALIIGILESFKGTTLYERRKVVRETGIEPVT